jgi:tRNA-dihydrouridine synthase
MRETKNKKVKAPVIETIEPKETKVIKMNTEVTDQQIIDEIMEEHKDNVFIIRNIYEIRGMLNTIINMFKDKAGMVYRDIHKILDKVNLYTDSMSKYYGDVVDELYGKEDKKEIEKVYQESKEIIIDICDKDKEGNPIMQGEQYKLTTEEQRKEYSVRITEMQHKHPNLYNRTNLFNAIMNHCVNTFAITDKDAKIIFSFHPIFPKYKFYFTPYDKFCNDVDFKAIENKVKKS